MMAMKKNNTLIFSSRAPRCLASLVTPDLPAFRFHIHTQNMPTKQHEDMMEDKVLPQGEKKGRQYEKKTETHMKWKEDTK
jgi:hypothetical protein